MCIGASDVLLLFIPYTIRVTLYSYTVSWTCIKYIRACKLLRTPVGFRRARRRWASRTHAFKHTHACTHAHCTIQTVSTGRDIITARPPTHWPASAFASRVPGDTLSRTLVDTVDSRTGQPWVVHFSFSLRFFPSLFISFLLKINPRACNKRLEFSPFFTSRSRQSIAKELLSSFFCSFLSFHSLVLFNPSRFLFDLGPSFFTFSCFFIRIKRPLDLK